MGIQYEIVQSEQIKKSWSDLWERELLLHL